MRAQLRAQRARARATGQPGGNFLTEQEEDAIIEQMQKQTKLMQVESGGSRDIASDGSDSWNETRSDFARIGSGSDGFGNHVGDGSIASYHSGATAHSGTSQHAAHRLDSLAESLGELKSIGHSASSGSLFSGRSSERDHAYMRSVGNKKASEFGSTTIVEETDEEEETTSSTSARPRRPNDASDAEEDAEEEEVEISDVDMPGSFSNSRPTSKRVSRRDTRTLLQRLGASNDSDNASDAPEGSTMIHEELPSVVEPTVNSRDGSSDRAESEDELSLPELRRPVGTFGDSSSGLLSTLSPEAFRRVSTALEEVINVVSPNSVSRFGPIQQEDRGEENLDDIDYEMVTDSLDGGSQRGQSSQAEESAREAVDHFGGNNAGKTVHQKENLQTHQTVSEDALWRRNGRYTPDSDATSFRSAAEDAAALSSAHDALPDKEGDQELDEGDESQDFDRTPKIPQRAGTPPTTAPQAKAEDPRTPRKHQLSRSPIETQSQTFTDQYREGRTPTQVAGTVDDHVPLSLSKQAESPSTFPESNLVQSGIGKEGFQAGRSMESESERTEAPEATLSSLGSSTPRGLYQEQRVGTPTHTPVLSAGAIAARNQRYFPNVTSSSAATSVPQQYASGFKNSPITPSGMQNHETQQQAPPHSRTPAGSASSALARVTQAGERNGTHLPMHSMLIEPGPRVSEDILSPTTGRLFPQPPQHDPATAEPWQDAHKSRRYTSDSTDAASYDGGSDIEHAEQAEAEADSHDVWARVARNLSPDNRSRSDADRQYVGQLQSGHIPQEQTSAIPDHPYASQDLTSRPYSHLPPSEAAATFEASGFTVNSLAAMQEDLVRSASSRQPRTGLSPPLGQDQMYSPSQHDVSSHDLLPKRSMSPSSFARLEQARARARMIAERTRSPQGSQNGSPRKNPSGGGQHLRTMSGDSMGDAAGTPFAGLTEKLEEFSSPPHGTTSVRPAINGIPASGSFKSQVMYDVTTSHRPTSPPPRRTSTASSTLPSLQDLSLMSGFQAISIATDPDRIRSIGEGPEAAQAEMEGGNLPHGGMDARDYGGLFGSTIPEEDGHSYRQDSHFGGSSANSPVTKGLHTVEGPSGLSHSHSQNVLNVYGSAQQNRSPASVQTSWSDPNSTTRGDRQFSANLVDDVANQARNATTALKGPHSGDGGPRMEPRKSRTLSKRKAKKNPGKYIGMPELLSTSQNLGHAQPIVDPVLQSQRHQNGHADSPTTTGKRRQPPRQASDYKNDPKSAPAPPVHRRASSSFGHSGQLNEDSPSTQALATRGHLPPQSPTVFVPGMAMHRAPSPVPSRSRATTPGTPSQSKAFDSRAAGGGSIGRLMSRMRIRKSPVLESSSQLPSAPDTPLPTAAVLPTDVSSGATARTPDSRLHSPNRGPARGASPFGLSRFNAQTDQPLPESGAIKVTTAAPSPNLERAEPVFGQWARESDVDAVTPEPATHSREEQQGALRGIAGSNSRMTSELADTGEGDGFGGFMPAAWTRSASASQDDTRQDDRLEPMGSRSPVQGMATSVSQDTIQAGRQGATTASEGAQGRASASELATDSGNSGLMENMRDSPASPSKSTKRKSARDTVIRRTLIFPNEAAAAWAAVNDERRRSIASTAPSMASKRKSTASRKTHNNDGADDDEANASYAALLAAANADPAWRNSSDEGASLRAPGPHRFAAASLRPPSGSGYSTRRASAIDGGSYAGSLYDMYIDEDGATSDQASLRSSFYPPTGATGNHIEVTERADGSIVWQVIAGLGRGVNGDHARHSGVRDSSSGAAPMPGAGAGNGHSRVNSDASHFSFLNRPPRDSMEASAFVDGKAAADGGAEDTRERTFTGMLKKDEDSRSLFAKRRPHSPPSAGGLGNGIHASIHDVPLPPMVSMDAKKRSIVSDTKSRPTSDANDNQQLAFDMATPGASGMTRVVYSNDVELEQLLESLAKQNDAAMFHFDPKQYYAQVEAHRAAAAAAARAESGKGTAILNRPISRLYRADLDDEAPGASKSIDAEPLPRVSSSHAPHVSPQGGVAAELHDAAPTGYGRSSLQGESAEGGSSEMQIDPRRRVEDEIMTLLSRGGFQSRLSASTKSVDDLDGTAAADVAPEHDETIKSPPNPVIDATLPAVSGPSMSTLDSATRPFSEQSQPEHTSR
ncbi:unnamed protein product [Parajaminaea phylloscopi]